MNNSTSLSGICFPYTNPEYQAITVLSSCVALVSAIACVLVTVGIVYSKKYLFFMQRLILYLCLAATLNATAQILRIHSVFDDDSSSWQNNSSSWQDNRSSWQDNLCMASGFFEQVSGWWQLLAVSCITLSVFVKVVCNRNPERVEVLFPLFIFLFPLTFSWIPFLHHTYGRAGAWCWIREVNSDCNKDTFGQYLRFGLWFIPLYLTLFALVLSYLVILCKIRQQKREWHGRYDPDAQERRERMRKEVWPLLWYPAFYIFLSVFPLMNRIQGAIQPHNPILTLWVLQAVSVPLQGGFVCVAYALDGETLTRLNCLRLLNACRRQPEIREYHHKIYPSPSDSLLGTHSHQTEEM